MKLTEGQIEILQNGKIEENRFYLQGQLDRKAYVDINKVLETIGLKWNRGKKAHIVEDMSEEELKSAIQDICETGEVETLQETIKKFQFYPTPKEVAEYLVELAEIKADEKVLEPSAGL
jgi:type I restriction-modification system DNA methylase subunit